MSDSHTSSTSAISNSTRTRSHAPEIIFELNGTVSGHVPSHEISNLPKPFSREVLPLPDLSEVQVIRHFTRLASMNYGVDTGMYPLGSCTMKYNPKICEDASRMEGFSALHPMTPEKFCQGSLELLYNLERYLCEITGMDACTLWPDAGAHGELTSVMIARKHFGKKRSVILIPDTAHGTNPASGAMGGFEIRTVKSDARGNIDITELEKEMTEEVAMLMVTNPNTLGLFEEQICKVSEIVHAKGGLLYCDGANMNAMLGVVRPGDFGADIMHLNLHKTFSTPHGGGGPGCGPVCVKTALEKYLPRPRILKKGDRYTVSYAGRSSIGRVSTFFGNFGVAVRAYAYIRSLGPELKNVAEMAVLNANYLMRRLQGHYDLPYNRICAHEFVLAGTRRLSENVHTTDIAKRLLDYGHHAPTIYFPLVVKEAIMVEPTETEPLEKLDEFAKAMITISCEPAEDLLRSPQTTPIGRLDGVIAARQPNLRWTGQGK